MQAETTIIKNIYDIVDAIDPQSVTMDDEQGQPTTDREAARVISFPYYNYGNISISILNPNNLLVLVTPNIEENMDDDDNTKFTKEEFEKFRRVVHYMEHTTYHPDKVAEGRKDFFNWFNTLDQRRNTDFKKAFPEMKKFYRQCGIVNG